MFYDLRQAVYLNGITNHTELLAVVREPDATWVIPSEDEWYKAAYHYNDGITGNYWDYPTQSDTMPTSEVPPGIDMTNGSANYVYSTPVDPVHDRTEVGAYSWKPSCSAYGTYDQGGNVWEWNEAVLYDSWRGIRGGWYVGNDINLRAAWRENGTSPGGSEGTGFRVAVVPYPGPGIPTVSEWGLLVMALLVLTAATLMYARRHAGVA